MQRTLSTRQNLRRGIIFGLFLLFPLIYNFFSPYLIIDAATEGILSGSAVMFIGMFLSSLFLGRGFCGWVCPAGGLQEACFAAQPKRASNRANWIKWLIWLPWFGLIVTLFVLAGGVRGVGLLHKQDITQGMDAADTMRWFGMYIFVAGMIFTLAMTAGKRAFCHYACWMAPFMMIGRWIRNRVGWPALQLQSNAEKCTDCKTCTRNCQMSLDVNVMVHAPNMEHSECILCGSCIDGCTKDAIRYRFGAPKNL